MFGGNCEQCGESIVCAECHEKEHIRRRGMKNLEMARRTLETVPLKEVLFRGVPVQKFSCEEKQKIMSLYLDTYRDNFGGLA